jgi:hypothetical protein
MKRDDWKRARYEARANKAARRAIDTGDQFNELPRKVRDMLAATMPQSVNSVDTRKGN